MNMKRKVVSNDIVMSEIASFLSEGKDVRMLPKGVSMHPFIRGGKDSVLLRSKDRYQEGDIVLACISDSRYVLHRIISLDGNRVILMGDGNIAETESCDLSEISGYVVTIYKGNEQIDCTSRSHLRKARIWRNLLPLRRYLLTIYRRICK